MKLQTDTLTAARMNDFIIFIISNGRPDNVITVETLKKAGSQIPFYIVIDNDDKSRSLYEEKFENILVFDKKKYAQGVDNFDNFNNYRSTTHARNACFDMAELFGYTYFLVLDDDYTSFKLRINENLEHPESCPNLTGGIDDIFKKTLEYYKKCSFTSLCFSQGGDWFGGETQFGKKPKRKAMNSFFCSTERRFSFISRLNEDVNTYMTLGNIGSVFMTIPFVQLDQMQTQSTSGGMTESYIKGGTYTKSFYTVMCRPDCTQITTMGRSQRRLHHVINWKNAVPMIIDEKWKK